MASILQDCADQIVTDLNSLALANMRSGTDAVKRTLPWSDDSIWQGITVHLPEREWEELGTNECDDFAYPILVTVITGHAGGVDYFDDIPEWRQLIRNKFHNQRLSGVTSVYRCRVKFGRVVLPKQWRDQYRATTLAVVCYSREDIR